MLATSEGSKDGLIGFATRCSLQHLVDEVGTTDDASANRDDRRRPNGVPAECIGNHVAFTGSPHHGEGVGGRLLDDPDKAGVVHGRQWLREDPDKGPVISDNAERFQTSEKIITFF